MVKGIIGTVEPMSDEMAAIIGWEPVRLTRISLRRS
ncbi:MAG: hypothetical protein Q27BB25_16980 [Blastomonas sp. CACIA14H2]|nr:MAG: hypothetical protein Q27BB25_16980 [Blastomonas sp. CACIA14H2]